MASDLDAHQRWMEDLGAEAARRRYMPDMADVPDDMMPDGVSVSKEDMSASGSVADQTVNPPCAPSLSSVKGIQ